MVKHPGRLILLLIPFLLLSCSDKKPIINSINPPVGTLGEVIAIRGENFGDEQGESYITIAGVSPTSSSYAGWRDDQILIRVPDFGDSGLIYVHRDGKKSNAALFSNRAAMPELAKGASPGTAPLISSISPQAGMIGSAVTIQGQNFGPSREDGRVLFFWDSESPLVSSKIDTSWVEVSAMEYGYDSWSEREIRVRVPDGAFSGNVMVETSRGRSKPVFFDVTGKPGTKTFKDKRSYAISYSVDIKVNESKSPNNLYLWLPKPAVSSSQKVPELLARSIDPFVENHRGTSLYQFKDLKKGASFQVTLSYLVDVYAVETTIRPQQVRQTAKSALASVYTNPSALVPSNNPLILEYARTICGREQNPYLKAQKIYQWIIDSDNIQMESLDSGGALEALNEKKADAYRASLLFCSLARAAGVPSLPVAGVLIDRFRTTKKHYWAEFWIDGMGWIPVDLLLGSGSVTDAVTLKPDSSSYYFGSIDNQRITFSRGETTLSQMDHRGRITFREREYAMQNLWEEATGGLDSYSSLWTDVAITGTYVN